MNSVLTAYIDAWHHYETFRGRATRLQFWSFVLVNMLIDGLFWALGHAMPHSLALLIVHVIFDLATVVPTFAVAARRLHDTNRSAAWLWLLGIPLVGWIVLIGLLALPSDPQPNPYDDDPHAI